MASTSTASAVIRYNGLMVYKMQADRTRRAKQRRRDAAQAKNTKPAK